MASAKMSEVAKAQHGDGDPEQVPDHSEQKLEDGCDGIELSAEQAEEALGAGPCASSAGERGQKFCVHERGHCIVPPRRFFS